MTARTAAVQRAPIASSRRTSGLALVPPASSRPHRTPFVLLVVGVLAVGLVGLLLLNTTLAQGSFRVHDLQRRTAALQDQEQQLQIGVDEAATPERLARAARKLGLVPASDPGFLRLRDGRILGDPHAATAPIVHVTTRPSATPSAAPKPTHTPAAEPSEKNTVKPTPKPAPKASPRRSGGRR